jgi:hypothetical protein
MQVAWHNRAGPPPLDATKPQFTMATLDDLLELVESSNGKHREAIEYLKEENRLLKESRGGRRSPRALTISIR